MGDTLLREKGSVKMENVEGVKRKSKGKESRFGKRYGFEIKLRCVKLQLEEGLPFALLCKEAGVSKGTLGRWVRDYQEKGEAGLRRRGVSARSRRRLPVPVSEKIVEIKKREPFFGVKRISHLLKRVERVNNFETLARRIYCSNSSLFAGLGGLIQAASGSLGGTGTFFTNLSGCAS